MNKKFTPYIYIVFFLCFCDGIFGQDLKLNLIGKDSIQTSILNQVSYQKNHFSEKDIYEEISAIHEKVKRLGFFTSMVKNVTNLEKDFTATFYLGSKTEEISILLPKDLELSSFRLKDSIRIKTDELDNFIQVIISELDKKGSSFSEVKLVNPVLKDAVLFVTLTIQKSDQRGIDKIIVKNYEEFPTSYLKNYFKVQNHTIFSKQKLKDISLLTKGLVFIKELKPPEVLFKKDSTILYLFLEKLKVNSIDGIVNFSSKENGDGVLLNGNLDLKLNNILNTGENFELFWNRIGEEKSEFKLSTRLPYLFNTAVSTKLAFNIYRQDSTFLNTKFNLDFDYQLNSNSNLTLSYTSEKSDYLLDTSSNFESYSNYFLGLGYSFNIPEDEFFYKNKFYFQLNPTYGSRKTNLNKVNQFKITLSSYVNFPISKRSYLYLKNETGFLESENFLINEIFRIGGANSLRGFNEQSIFTNKYSYINLEYRFLTSSSSYLHSITDFGFFKDPILNKTNNALGLGIGYLFRLNNNQINLGYVIGKSSNNNLDFKDSKFIISWKSFF